MLGFALALGYAGVMGWFVWMLKDEMDWESAWERRTILSGPEVLELTVRADAFNGFYGLTKEVEEGVFLMGQAMAPAVANVNISAEALARDLRAKS